MLPKPVAVVCSDIHLSHNPPVFRSDEPDWYAAMQRTLDQVAAVCTEEGNLPLIIAGDIFDRWNSPPQLITFAIDQFAKFPNVYAIPGQHDLPNHRYDEMDRSAYGVLCRGCIENLDTYIILERLNIFGFPWGFALESAGDGSDKRVSIVHRYIWQDSKSGYPGASKDQHVANLIHDYDLVISGDNHIPFVHYNDDRITIFNCGGLFRRKADDLFDPRIGILYDDATIVGRKLDCSEDKYSTSSNFQTADVEIGILEVITGMNFDSINFRDIVSRESQQLKHEVRQMVIEDVEG